jgi:hypothetical protein
LVKQIKVSEGISYIYNTFDFDFFVTLAKHPKLNVKHGTMLADILAKIYLDDVTYATASAVPMMLLISRYISNEGMREFVLKFLTVIFPMLLSLEKT